LAAALNPESFLMSDTPLKIPAAIASKVALVTGSTGGIGQAILRALAAQGCKVMMHGLGDPAEIEARRAALQAEAGVQVHHHGADLADPAQVRALFETTSQALGPVEILVNNAVTRNFHSIEDLPLEQWNQAVAVNLSAPFQLIQLALPGMKARRWGRIVNMASNWGLTGTTGRADYVATKHGVVGLTRAAALEALPYNITCNAIAPGSVLTPHAERQVRARMERDGTAWDEAERDFLTTRQPSGRFVRPEQVADLIVFLCSPAASEMTGTPISIDGGWNAT
jgi:3-hydroxybutyrate dehydrogenase